LNFVLREGVGCPQTEEVAVSARESLRIGEVAGLLGTNTNTIRYYHEVGLVPEPERTDGGFRLYDAEDVLALRRVCWLRSLGLPIREVRKVLTEPEETTLRESLAALEQGFSARILELEGHREKTRELLEHEDLGRLLDAPAGPFAEDPDAGEGSWREFAEEFEAEYPPSREEKEQTRLLERSLGAFRWPASFRLMFEDFSRQIRFIRERDPKNWERSMAETGELTRRFSALRDAPEDSPEVERLVADYAEYLRECPVEPELAAAYERHKATLESPLFQMAGKLIFRTFSPAQRRFFMELEKRAL
jgi:DNA-binding transcriptional MerR regulator